MTSAASLYLPSASRALSLSAVYGAGTLRESRGRKVAVPTRCSLRYWMHSNPVDLVSTPMASTLDPAATVPAMLNLRWVGLHRSTSFP